MIPEMHERFLNKALAFSFFFENNENMPANIKSQNLRSETKENQLELESIDFFVRMMGILGMPRSVGEIYGLLYFSEAPLSMDQIVHKLGMSLGSASQGLKTLRSLKAVRTSYVAGERKDHYQAETEFRRLFSNFLKEEILPHMESASERIKRMETVLPSDQSGDEFYKVRIEKLKKLTRAGGRLLPALAGLLKL
jgi:DNA-binding transcriptional regulator GbsR (MarR family)